MAVSLTNTGIRFSDTSTQNTKGAVLGNAQYGAYNLMGGATGANYSANAVSGAVFASFASGDEDLQDGTGVRSLIEGTANTVVCGFQSYRSGVFDAPGDSSGTNDSSLVQVRLVYRSIS